MGLAEKLLLPFIIAFSASLLLTYLVRIVAIKRKWIYIPRKDRWNTRVVALMGGIAIFLAFVLTFLLFHSHEYLFIAGGAALLFVAGFLDDKFELNPLAKFLIQFLAASLLIIAGFTLSSAWPFWLAIPLTYIWVIGITNAFNLLDNMDGLMAGIAVICSLVCGILAIEIGTISVAVLSFIMAGSIGGFLVFNYHPAKIFMGDCGSLFVGYLLAAFPLLMEPNLTAFAPAAVLPLLTALFVIPIFDTTMVTFLRIFKGRSPSQGGSDHSSHRLVLAGLSEKTAVNTLYGIAVYFGLIALIFYPNFIQLFYIMYAVSTVGLLLFGLHLARFEVYEKEKLSKFEIMVNRIPNYFKRKIQLGTIIVDVVLIIASFTLAHFIRFEEWSTGIEQAVIQVLPGIIVIKVFILAGMGIYKSEWRHAGVADMMRLLIATFLASLVSASFAWIYAGGYISASVFVVDWFLFLLLVTSSRFAFKGLRRLTAIPANGGNNVLLYGAGDAGWLALSEIRQNPGLKLDPVGFIDDSLYKQKSKLQGLKVLGNYNDLLSICKEYEVDEVLICIRNISAEKRESVRQKCVKENIKCKELSLVFNNLKSDNGIYASRTRSYMELQKKKKKKA
jgi:UDP-GlcNAc:undecaprenyl-phosphate GlcNAc-1-phosphate transferase